MDDEPPTVFSHDANVDPTLAFDEFGPSDVVHILLAIRAMVPTFVIQSDHRFVIAHVDERLFDPVAHPDLRLRPRQSGIDQHQSKCGFPRRLRARIHQVECAVCERPLRSGQVAAEVQRGANWCGDRQFAELGDLVRSDPFLTHDNACPPPRVLADDLDRRRSVDPFRAV
jgi:hypothetical protein